VHIVYRAGVVIKLQHVFPQAPAFYVSQQGVKILLELIIANHVFYGLVIVDMVVMFFDFLSAGFCYDPATQPTKAIAG